MQRVVSLLPAATEIICALDGLAQLVGISHECDYPAAVTSRPVLTRSRVDSADPSHAIDAAVKRSVADALSIYAVDGDQLAALAPDVLVTQDVCEVCAVSLDDVHAAMARLSYRAPCHLVNLRPTRLAHVLDDIDRVAAAIGRSDRAPAVRAALADRIGAVTTRATAATATPAGRPRTVALEWLDPLMTGGLWTPELIELAGGHAPGSYAGAPSLWVDLDQLAALRPDVVVAMPCGFSLARALAEPHLLDRVAAALPATTRIYVTDGNAYFNRPGPRLVDSLELLAACIHPAAFADHAATYAAAIHRLR